MAGAELAHDIHIAAELIDRLGRVRRLATREKVSW
jgi:hypothetical protein